MISFYTIQDLNLISVQKYNNEINHDVERFTNENSHDRILT
jgi:hypothetical protein